MNLGGPELIILAIIVLVVFGGSGLNKAARNLGRAKVEVEKAQKTYQDTIDSSGLKQADAALKKANRALNQSPQSMMRQAAKSVTTPKAAAAAEATDAAASGEEAIADSATDTPDIATDTGNAANINIDFSND